MRWFFGKPRMESAAAGFAVRVDYPTLGTHEFIGFRPQREPCGWGGVGE